ncbi:hypothetical protein GCM10023194_30520 [Planotetraspora phitsanulokensis]|uniref:Uncharacterized protein n=1 Tax=Planotetraspora phitsanulokensis TaxID=575192 RepID=A0A8J3XC98_9ACTN|nr:hypothetical protein [Planotetraspora phitsanulokensis]GII35810.1 hypothetical protein Pph01_08130 [Planotetraspora phitsanulokensis]
MAPGDHERDDETADSSPEHNAICLGGPCHGMLTHIEQDIGLVTVPVPPPSPGLPAAGAPYRVTHHRVHHPSFAEPFTALHWADTAVTICVAERDGDAPVPRPRSPLSRVPGDEPE